MYVCIISLLMFSLLGPFLWRTGYNLPRESFDWWLVTNVNGVETNSLTNLLKYEVRDNKLSVTYPMACLYERC
jgi:hypothetical protein